MLHKNIFSKVFGLDRGVVYMKKKLIVLWKIFRNIICIFAIVFISALLIEYAVYNIKRVPIKIDYPEKVIKIEIMLVEFNEITDRYETELINRDDIQDFINITGNLKAKKCQYGAINGAKTIIYISFCYDDYYNNVIIAGNKISLYEGTKVYKMNEIEGAEYLRYIKELCR